MAAAISLGEKPQAKESAARPADLPPRRRSHLPHVIAGSVGTFYLVVSGGLSPWACLGGYVLPAFLGNVIGGAALVALGAHAEFISSAPEEKKPAR